MNAIPEKARLFLIDGMSQVYRAFYAIRRLNNSQGLPTNAVFGFITMLRRLVEQEQPHYLGVAFDPPGPTFRHQQYEEYKANRKPTPPDLILQIPYVKAFCQAMNIPVLERPGYEADDVIGTLATKAEAIGLDCVIVSLDKDMCQLVNPRVRLLDTRQEYIYYDRQKVIEKMGVPPEKIIDLLSLWGDSSDNVPGAPGIGEKGALELLRQFANLEDCLLHWEKVQKKSYRESLRDHVDLIRQSRELVTIQKDLPIELDLERLVVGPPNYNELSSLYQDLGFQSLLPSLPVVEAKPDAIESHSITDPSGMVQFMEAVRTAGLLSFQLDNQSEPPRLIFALAPRSVYLLELDRHLSLAASIFQSLQKESIPMVTFDLKSFALEAKPWLGDLTLDADDLLVMDHLANASGGAQPLEQILFRHLEKRLEAGGRVSAEYTLAMIEVRSILERVLEEKQLGFVYREIEKPLLSVLTEMELDGIGLDVTLLQEFSSKANLELHDFRLKIYSLAGLEFNLDSPKQVGEVLFERMKLPILKRTRKTKSHSTDQEVLEELAASYEVPKLLLEYRQLAKLKSTYMDALPRMISPRTGRIHTSFNQTATATGRLSSSNPNLQNIPIRTPLGRRIREAFCAAPGYYLVSADYSQIELRIMAHLSEDKAMIAAFRSGEDIHERTAREVFGLTAQLFPEEYRRRAKVINFGILYGLSSFGLAKDLQISRPEAQRFIDQYFLRYPGIRHWIDATIRQAMETAEVRTLFGRIRPIPELKNSDKNVRSFGERAAVNAPIQGTAADLIKLAMIRLHRALHSKRLKSRILLQVHDELVLETPHEELEQTLELTKNVMQDVCQLRVPLLVEIGYGSNWKDAK